MSNSIFEFNVDTVVSIKKRLPTEVDYYVWSDRKVFVKKYFFGLFKKEHVIEEGWYDISYHPIGEKKKTTEYFERHGYIIIDGKIFNQAYVEISFLNGNTKGYSFPNSVEADSFVDKVKKASNKTYL
jgi:methionine salvage enolase-phosphatase E1